MESPQDVGCWDHLLNYLARETGLVFSEPRLSGARKAVLDLMKQMGCGDLPRFQQELTAQLPLREQLIAELTVGETYFFREPGQFHLIEHQLLPELRDRSGKHFRPRAWSAGCSSGEEAYSLAILFEEQKLPRSCSILASDISQVALQKAQRGCYRDWSFRGAGASRAIRSTQSTDQGRQIVPEIRARVVFRSLNLATDDYPAIINGTASTDLILCRNVLIYFEEETIQRVARKLFNCLNEGGWLLTAATDPPLDGYAPFEVKVHDSGIYYQRPAEPGESLIHPGDENSRDASSCECSRASLLSAKEESLKPALLPKESISPAFDAEKIQAQLQKGNYAFVIDQTHHLASEQGRELYLHALSNVDPVQAEQVCEQAVKEFPCSAMLRYRHALLLWELDRRTEALRAIRQVLFLDSKSLVGHDRLGTMLQQMGDLAGAARAYRNVLELSQKCNPEALVPLAEEQHVSELAQSARSALEKLTAKLSLNGRVP